jgi:hypothetical protein
MTVGNGGRDIIEAFHPTKGFVRLVCRKCGSVVPLKFPETSDVYQIANVVKKAACVCSDIEDNLIGWM